MSSTLEVLTDKNHKYHLGLVFAGGGGKGAYEIGVWKYLKEIGLDQHIEAVSGTSVGALNAAMFAGSDYETAERIWENISRDQILTAKQYSFDYVIEFVLNLLKRTNYPINFNNPDFWKIVTVFAYYIISGGVCSRSGLENIIREALDFDKLNHSAIPCFVTCFNCQTNAPERFKLNNNTPEKVKQLLLASSAMPLIFPLEEINGVEYYDGGIPGIGDNIPIEPLDKLGIDVVISVQLDQNVIQEENKYPKVKVIKIIPQNNYKGLTGTLDFEAESAQRKMSDGYKDARAIFEGPCKFLMYEQVREQELRKMQECTQLIQETQNGIYKHEISSSSADNVKDSVADNSMNPDTMISKASSDMSCLLNNLLKENKNDRETVFMNAVACSSQIRSQKAYVNYQNEKSFFSSFLNRFLHSDDELNSAICENSAEAQKLLLQLILRLAEENTNNTKIQTVMYQFSTGIYRELKEDEADLKEKFEKILKLHDADQKKFDLLYKQFEDGCSCTKLEKNQYLCPECGRINWIKASALSSKTLSCLKQLSDTFSAFDSESPKETHRQNLWENGNPVFQDKVSKTITSFKKILFLYDYKPDLRLISSDFEISSDSAVSLSNEICPILPDSVLHYRSKFRQFTELCEKPYFRVALAGERNAGKSAILNEILGRKIATVSNWISTKLPVEYHISDHYALDLLTSADWVGQSIREHYDFNSETELISRLHTLTDELSLNYPRTLIVRVFLKSVNQAVSDDIVWIDLPSYQDAEHPDDSRGTSNLPDNSMDLMIRSSELVLYILPMAALKNDKYLVRRNIDSFYEKYSCQSTIKLIIAKSDDFKEREIVRKEFAKELAHYLKNPVNTEDVLFLSAQLNAEFHSLRRLYEMQSDFSLNSFPDNKEEYQVFDKFLKDFNKHHSSEKGPGIRSGRNSLPELFQDENLCHYVEIDIGILLLLNTIRNKWLPLMAEKRRNRYHDMYHKLVSSINSVLNQEQFYIDEKETVYTEQRKKLDEISQQMPLLEENINTLEKEREKIQQQSYQLFQSLQNRLKVLALYEEPGIQKQQIEWEMQKVTRSYPDLSLEFTIEADDRNGFLLIIRQAEDQVRELKSRTDSELDHTKSNQNLKKQNYNIENEQWEMDHSLLLLKREILSIIAYQLNRKENL